MAITLEASAELTKQEAVPTDMLNPRELHGRMRVARFAFTQGAAAGDANSYARLIKLPAGKVRVFLGASRIACSAFGAARVLSLGWEAYKEGGVAVVADNDGLDVDQDVSAAIAYVPIGTLSGDETYEFNSDNGVVITGFCEGGTIPAAATLKGYLVYVQD
jgi:hypothetical protein